MQMIRELGVESVVHHRIHLKIDVFFYETKIEILYRILRVNLAELELAHRPRHHL